MPETQQDLLKRLTVNDIQKMYTDGKILAYQRNILMRDKAKQVTEEILGDKGYLSAVYTKMIEHAQHGWNNVIEAAQHETKPTITNKENVTDNQAKDVIGDVKRELYYSMLAAVGIVQTLISPLTAFGEVNGKVAENTLLTLGASPGLAWFGGVAVDVGSGFIPTGMISRAFAKAVRALPGVTAKVPDVTLFTPEEMKVFEIIKRALWKDGVPNAERAVNEAVETVTGNKLPALSKDVEAAIADVKAALEKSFKPVSTYLDEAAKIANGISKENAIKELPALAERFGINLEDIANVIPAKQLMNPKQMYGYLKALESQIEQLGQFAKDAINPKNTTAQSEFYQAIFARHVTELFTSVPGSAKINYNKQFMDMLLNWDPENVAKGDVAAAMKTFATDLANMSDNPTGLRRFVIDSQGGFLRLDTNWWPMAREAYQNLLLPFAWAPTFIGNSITVGTSVLERATGSLFSTDRAAGLVGRDALYYSKGLMLSFSDISSAFAKAFDREGLGAGRLDYVQGAIPGPIGSIIRASGNATLGMDNIFKEAFRRASIYTDAMSLGVHNGLKGEELGRYIQYRMMNPTEEMVTRANGIAMSNTFQDDLGVTAMRVKALAQTGPMVLYFPFMKSMINLIKFSWNRTPYLQLASKSLYEDILAGGARADMAVGRLTISQLWSQMIFELAKDGVITGTGPVDTAQRKSWLATHEPNSIKMGSGWVPYTNLEPLSFSLGLISNFSEIVDQLDEANVEQLGMAITYSTLHVFGNASFWHSTEDMMSVVQNFEKGTGLKDRTLQLLMSPATTVLSGGPIGQRVTKALDPFQHEVRTYLDSWMSKVYPYSTDLPPKRDGYADVVKPPEVVGNSWFGMFSPLAPKFKPETNDRVKLEGARLQAKLPVFPDNYGGNIVDESSLTQPLPGDRSGIALTLQERDRWQQIYKNILRSPEFGIEKTLLDNPTYNDTEQTPIGMQRLLFQNYLNKAQSEAWNGLVLENKNIAERLFKSKYENAAPLVNIQTREGLIQDVQQGQRLFESLAPEQRDNLLKWGVLAPEESTR